ncbi:MAG: type II toxin-antitoxin system RelE/ParE family toxin [Chloroflexi bacterium]|nr:type II toxin-antitoxin system RelE/ParE family toxin [Chloroflexota bacterium]
MAAVIWTAPALEDLDEICAHIADDSPRQAVLFAHRVFQSTERLGAFPKSGRVVPEFSQADVREIIFERYRIVYRIDGDSVRIEMVHHAARPLA